MKKTTLPLVMGIMFLWILTFQNLQAQQMGVSFSYFIPKNGAFSTPVSPFSLRGLGVKFNDFLGVETGFSLYRMAGMNIKGMDSIESTEPMLGPNFTLMVPLELAIYLGNDQHKFSIHGGGFLFYGFDNKLNYGNIDRAIRTMEGWSVANADFSFNYGLGLGILFGADYTVMVTNDWGITMGATYFIGEAPLDLKGYYKGGLDNGPVIYRNNLEFPDAAVDYTGLEISLGAVFGSR